MVSLSLVPPPAGQSGHYTNSFFLSALSLVQKDVRPSGPPPAAAGCWFPCVSRSALDSGDQVVEQEEDEHQAHGHVTQDPSIISAGANHGGETLHAAAQQASRTQEV